MKKSQPIGSNDACILVVEQGEDAFAAALDAAQRLAACGGAPRHQVVFAGYDADPREVYEIDDCRRWCLRLMRDCPQFYTVAHPDTRTLLLYCTANKLFTGERVVNPEWSTVEPDLANFQLVRQW